jgi:hypothetical protein
MSEPIHILSLGAGVQSSTLALMAARGEVPGPKLSCAIFADTQAEPPSVYRWLDWLEKQLPFPVHRVTAGSLTDGSLRIGSRADGSRWIKGHVPAFVTKPDGSVGPLWRTCTADYKLAPLFKKQRELAGIGRGEKTVRAVTWIGISLDEVSRMKDSREPWAENRWPLIEMRMNRHDCFQWMKSRGYPNPPRSACSYCPFHSDAEWRRLKTEEPEAFQDAIAFEQRLQAVSKEVGCHSGIPTLHRSGVAIEKVDFSTEEEKGQISLFQNECEGMCGV